MDEGPLSGVRVVELCSWLTGPLATCILGDQGADVIKVESPTGDEFRQTGTSRGGMAAMFMAVNRNKRSICLDLKNSDDLRKMEELVATADVFVENMKRGTMDRLGLDTATLRRKYPKMICVSMSGYGQTGPKSKEGTFDPMVQAMCGLASIQGGNERDKPQLVRSIVIDKLMGPVVAQAISSALFQRERKGVGCLIECSMLDAAIWWMWPDGMTSHAFVGEGVRTGGDSADSDALCKTKDGYVVTAPFQQPAWEAFLRLADKPELGEDPRLRTLKDRGQNFQYYGSVLRASFGERTTEEWCRLLSESGIPNAPVLRRDQILQHPQVVWNDIVEEKEHPSAGRFRSIRAPARFDGKAAGVRRPAPDLGADTQSVLDELEVRSKRRGEGPIAVHALASPPES